MEIPTFFPLPLVEEAAVVAAAAAAVVAAAAAFVVAAAAAVVDAAAAAVVDAAAAAVVELPAEPPHAASERTITPARINDQTFLIITFLLLFVLKLKEICK